MKRLLYTVLVTFAQAFGSPCMAGDQTPAVLTHRIDAFVTQEMQRQKVPGVAVAVVHHGQVVLSKGYGLSNVELGVPVTSETMFQSGSLGKQFTATAVSLLVEDGKLALDDSVTKYFTDAPASWRLITIRNLLTHTSGIPDYEVAGNAALRDAPIFDYRRDYTEDELTKIAYSLPLKFRPGSRWSYSNTGYVLLGLLVRKVSGEFYGDILKRRVFWPLGMATARVISEADIVPHRAAGYRLEKGELKNQEWVSPVLNSTADGSLYLSLKDWIAWDRGLRAHKVLSDARWADIYTPVTLISGKTYPYGFGWRLDRSNGKPWYLHSGSWQGFMTFISRYGPDDLTVIVLCNSAQAQPWRIVDGVAKALDPNVAPLSPSTPLAESDPSMAKRVRTFLASAAEGRLAASDLPADSDFEVEIKELEQTLKPLGALQKLDLVDRRELGDDVAWTYLATYSTQVMRLQFTIGPDQRPTSAGMSPQVP